MRAVIQRVSRGEVRVDGEVVGRVERGLLALVGVVRDDEADDLAWMAKKLLGLRVFPDEEGRMNRSVVDVGGSVLMVSQFTVCGDVNKGTRPSFGKAMAPEPADRMFRELCARVGEYVPVETGRFQTHMVVDLLNDGPVTLWLDSKARGRG